MFVFETKIFLFALYFEESSGSNFPCLDWSLKWLVNAFYSILSSDLRAEVNGVELNYHK
jgi:hypothetical protein